MGATERMSLIIESKTRGSAEVDRLAKALNDVVGISSRSEKGFQQTGAAAGASALKFAALTAAALGYAKVLQTMTVNTAKFAARAQTMAVVVDNLAKVNNLDRESTRARVEAIKAQGIATTEAREVVSKMIFAQLDLAKATDLARLAQNAAVIGMTNSSEALAGIIHGITTRQIENLRTYGLIVNFQMSLSRKPANMGAHSPIRKRRRLR